MTIAEISNTGSIGGYCFRNSGLTSVTIGNSVTDIGHGAFQNCSSLTTAEITNAGSIGVYCFRNSGLTSITIGNSVTDIGGSAFQDCSSLTTAEISNTGSIGEYCFTNSGLTSITIGNSVTDIGGSAFQDCSSLTTAEISNTGSIGEYCFTNSGLTSITIGKTVTSIGNSCFKDCYSLKNIIINNRETELRLGHNESSPLFVDCPIDSVYIGGKIEYDKSSSKGYSPFYRNTSLRTVVITDNETEIYDNEFYGCTNLKDVKIGDGVKKIGNWAFSGCSNLDYFAFGTNVEIIGEEAFSDCTNVNNIISYSVNPPKCGTQALDDINKWNCTLKVLDKSVTAYQSADQWKDFFFIESLSIDGKVATPIIKLDDKTISITCETEKASIYYTLDGTNPTVESALYSGPFTLEKNCTIKAVATRLNYENSDISMLEVTSIQIYATSISLDKTEASIEEKSYLQLIATILPEHTTNKEVTWSSSNNSVASVEGNGLVTMYSVGEATITAATTDGTNLSASCLINVYSGIDGVNGDNVMVATIGGNIVVKNARLGSIVNVYASNGALIKSMTATDGSVVIEALIKGIYVVAIDGKSFKVMVK